MRTVVVDTLLALTVLSELICVVGVFTSATIFARLHYAGATTSLAPFFVLAAVAIRQPHPYTAPVWNALFVAVALFALNNVLTQAIANVAKQHEL
ncbi:MAG: monovalent cation/H(+) antiporter subunit G [Gaiellaceae bacterium]